MNVKLLAIVGKEAIGSGVKITLRDDGKEYEYFMPTEETILGGDPDGHPPKVRPALTLSFTLQALKAGIEHSENNLVIGTRQFAQYLYEVYEGRHDLFQMSIICCLKDKDWNSATWTCHAAMPAHMRSIHEIKKTTPCGKPTGNKFYAMLSPKALSHLRQTDITSLGITSPTDVRIWRIRNGLAQSVYETLGALLASLPQVDTYVSAEQVIKNARFLRSALMEEINWAQQHNPTNEALSDADGLVKTIDLALSALDLKKNNAKHILGNLGAALANARDVAEKLEEPLEEIANGDYMKKYTAYHYYFVPDWVLRNYENIARPIINPAKRPLSDATLPPAKKQRGDGSQVSRVDDKQLEFNIIRPSPVHLAAVV
jgi:hypothetical protein